MLKIDNSLTLNSLNSKSLKSKELENLNDAKLKEQTDSFEAVFLKMVLDKSLKSENHLFPKGVGEDIYKSMYSDALSKEMSGGFGFSQMLFDFLKRNS